MAGGHTVSQADVDMIRTWKAANRFALVQHPPMTRPVLFAQSTMQRVPGEEDNTE